MKNEYMKTNLLQWAYFAFHVMAYCVSTNRTLGHKSLRVITAYFVESIEHLDLDTRVCMQST